MGLKMNLEIHPGDAFQKNDGRIYTIEKANSWVIHCYGCRMVKAKSDRYTWYLERSGLTEVWRLSDFLKCFKPAGE